MSYMAKIKQNGIIVAQAESMNKEDVEKEIGHYALLYSQDGAIEVIRNYPNGLLETDVEELFDFIKEKGLSNDFGEWKIKKFKPKKIQGVKE